MNADVQGSRNGLHSGHGGDQRQEDEVAVQKSTHSGSPSIGRGGNLRMRRAGEASRGVMAVQTPTADQTLGEILSVSVQGMAGSILADPSRSERDSRADVMGLGCRTSVDSRGGGTGNHDTSRGRSRIGQLFTITEDE